MPLQQQTRPPRRRWFAAAGALLVACGIATAAWSAHGAEGTDAQRLSHAALHLLVHGVALVALDRAPGSAAPRDLPLLVALSLLLVGTLLFAGALIGAVAFATPVAAAPIGGAVGILGWIAAAGAVLRR